MDKVYQWLISSILGIVATITQEYGLIIFLVCGAVILDVITGLLKCKITDIKISSGTGRKGFFRKLSLFVGLTFGIFIDAFIPFLLDVVGVDLGFNSPFGLIVGVYIILNESISICENLYMCNPNAIPKSIVNILKVANKKINESGDNIDKEDMS